MEQEDLKKKIMQEMTVSYANMLEKNFDLAKEFIRITSTGTVEVLNKEKISGTDKILLYLIGKRYAKEADFSKTELVTNKELQNELGIKIGSLLPWLKRLRDTNQISGDKGSQSIPISAIESTLKRIKEMVKNG